MGNVTLTKMYGIKKKEGKRGHRMEKDLRGRLLKFEEKTNLSGISPEDLREATLFTLRALKAHLEETKPELDSDIRTITLAIPIARIHLGE